MIFTYASHRSKPPSDKFTVQSIPGTAQVKERNFYIQYANRAGRSLLSDPQTVTGSGVSVTLQTGLILPGEEVFWIIVSYETTGEPEDAGIVAMWQARESNQSTRRTLPVVLEFVTNDSLLTNRAVESANQLPSVSSLPNGAIALVVDTGIYYRSDREAFVNTYGLVSYGAYPKGLNTKWIEWAGTFNAYVETTSSFFGSDVAVNLVTNSLEIPPKIADSDSIPIRYWLNNGLSADGGSPIVDGRYSLEIAVNGIEGYEGFFANNKIKYYLVGYLNRDTGILDDSIDTAGQLRYWNPGTGAIALPEDLPRNHAAVYDLILSFDNSDSIGILPGQSPEISLNFTQIFNIQGNLVEAANLIGDLVYQDRDKLLVVPGAFRLPGIASIKIDNASQGYLIDAKNTQPLVDLQPDTPNQVVALSGALNGYCTVRQENDDLEYSEVVRALISTVPGVSDVVVSNTITLSNQGIKVTVEHPITTGLYARVRSDYPDNLIADNESALFTPTIGYVYLDVDGTIYRSPSQSIVATTTQDFTYTSLTGFVAVSTLPNAPVDFCLFEAEDVVLTAIAGSFSGTVTAFFAYAYETPNYKATVINNQVAGGIVTASVTIAEIISSLNTLVAHLDDLNNPHQVTRGQIGAASQTDLVNHTNSRSNPHQVTTTQIGAATTAQLAVTNNNVTANTAAIALNTASRQSLGTAATKNVGTAINNVVQLQDVGGVAKLPAVDGSQLTGIGGQLTVEFVSGTFSAAVSAINPINYLIDTTTVVATANLPATPPNKGIVAFSDRRKTFGTKTATLVPGSGHTIDGGANFLLDFNNEAVTLIFDAANNNYSVLEGIQNTSTGSGDMSKSVYDTNNSGVVDNAEAIAGTPGNSKFYGTNATGIKGFYDYLVGAAVKAALESLVSPNKLLGSAIANARNISNAPIDGYVRGYDLATDSEVWQPPVTNLGAGAILLPLSQSLFEVADGTLSTYTPDIGSATYESIKILTTAATPNNQIVSEQLQINVANTGAVLNLGISNTVLRVNWIFNTGDTDCLIARYSSNGNMVILEMSGSAIAIKSIVNDVITTIQAQPYNFVDNTSYKIDLQVIGVVFKVLINDSVAIAEALSNEFLTATKFGIGKR